MSGAPKPTAPTNPFGGLGSLLGSAAKGVGNYVAGQAQKVGASPVAPTASNTGFGALNTLFPQQQTSGTRAASPTNTLKAPTNLLTKPQTAPSAQQPVVSPAPTGAQTIAGTDNSLGTANPNANISGGIFAPNLGQPSAPNTQQIQSSPTGTPLSPTGTPTYPGDVTSTPAQAQQPQPQTPQGILTQLLAASQPSSAAQGALGQEQSILQNLQQSQTNEANSLAQNYSNPIPLEFQQGRGQVLQNQYLQQQNALSSQAQAQAGLYTGALQQQQQQQSGLGTALGALTQTTQAPYGTPLYQPGTGQFINSAGSSGGLGNLDPQSALQSAASQLAQGTGGVGYSTLFSQLSSAYGPAIANQLLQKAQTLNPNFNAAQSDATAQATSASTLQTGTTGGQVTKAADSTNQALDTLAQSFQSLPGIQTGGIPATNSIANFIASQFGQQALSSYTAALADARAQLAGVLSASGSATPTGAQAMAQAYLPDSMTPQQFSQLVGTTQAPGTIRQLMQQKVGAYTTPPNTQSNGQSTTNPPGWF